MQMVAMPPAVLRGGSRVGRVLSGSYEPRSPWVAVAGKLSVYIDADLGEPPFHWFAYHPRHYAGVLCLWCKAPDDNGVPPMAASPGRLRCLVLHALLGYKASG